MFDGFAVRAATQKKSLTLQLKRT